MLAWKFLGNTALAFLLLLPAALPAQSAAAPEQTARLDDLVAEMLRSNPELKAASARYRAAMARTSVEGALPDPTFSFGWSSAGSFLPGKSLGEDPNSKIGFEVGQMLPYPGKRGLKTDVARKDAENQRYMYLAVVRDKVAALKQAYYDLALAYQATDLLNENQDVLRRLSKVAESRYSVGKAMQQDIIKSNTEVAILENRLVALDQQKQSMAAEINSLLNRPVDTPLPRVEAPADLPELEPLENLQARLKQNAPELLAQQAMIEGRKSGISLAQKEYYPDFDVMTGYNYMGQMPAMWEFKVGVSIPVFYKSKQNKEVEAATEQLTEAQQNYRAAEQMLSYRLRDAWLRAQSARKLAELYSKQIVPQSRLALESSLASYQTGGVDFLTVLSNFTTILDYRLNYYEQQAEYRKALATLEQLTAAQGAEVAS